MDVLRELVALVVLWKFECCLVGSVILVICLSV